MKDSFEKTISIRLHQDKIDEIKSIIRRRFDEWESPLFESESHFIRCAINEKIAKEREYFKQNGGRKR